MSTDGLRSERLAAPFQKEKAAIAYEKESCTNADRKRIGSCNRMDMYPIFTELQAHIDKKN